MAGTPAAKAEDPPPLDVRIEYAKTPPASAALVLVPPEDDDDDDEKTPPPAVAPAAPPVPPRRAADALPPRNRRSPLPTTSIDPMDAFEEVTEPRARHLHAPGTYEEHAIPSRAEGENERPSGSNAGVGAPLFSQEWGTGTSGPTWRPGAPPGEPGRSYESWWVVGVTAILAGGLTILWLALYWSA